MRPLPIVALFALMVVLGSGVTAGVTLIDMAAWNWIGAAHEATSADTTPERRAEILLGFQNVYQLQTRVTKCLWLAGLTIACSATFLLLSKHGGRAAVQPSARA